MALEDVTLPKDYKNSKVLYEQNLDAWRLATEDAFAVVNLNLTQIVRDAFSGGYTFDNDGNANNASSLQAQINALSSGATPITGTSSDTFTINTDGFSAGLTTASLTAARTFTFPDITGTFVVTEGAQTINGLKSFTINDASNTSVTRALAVYHTTSGTAAAGIGTEIALLAENGSGSSILTASLQGVFSTVTAGAEVSNLQFYITKAGSSINPLSLSTTNQYSGGLTYPGPSLLLKGNASQTTPSIIIQSYSSGGNAGLVLDVAVATSGQRAAGLHYGYIGNELVTLGLYNESTGATVKNIWCYDGSTGNFGVNTTGPDAKLDVLSTTEQFRQTYTDGAVYASHLVNSSGYYSIVATGNRYGFGISGPRATVDVFSTTEQIRQTYTDNTIYASHLVNSSGYYSIVTTGNRYGFGTSSPSTAFHIKVGSTAATRGIRVESDSGNNPFIQLTDGNHAFVPLYNVSDNTLDINYDDTVGTGTLTALKLNSSGELLLPSVDPPTANYMSRGSVIRLQGVINTTTPTLSQDFNVTSIAKNGTGDVTITIDTNFTASSYSFVVSTTDANIANKQDIATWLNNAAGSIDIKRDRMDLAAGTLTADDGVVNFLSGGFQ